MAFKFAILLLSSVIVNNSASPPTNEEVIHNAFEFAYDCYIYEEPGSDCTMSLGKSDFLDFVGKEDNFEYVNNFWSENSVSLEAQNQIYLEDFKELVTLICKNQGIDIKVFLEKRIAAAKLITNAFDIANGSNKLGPIRNTMSIRQSGFLDFVGKEDNLKYINSYWTANSASGKAQDNIGFKEFRELLYWICSKREFVISDFLEEKIPVAKAIKKSFDLAVDYYHNYCAENIIFSQSNRFPKFKSRYIRQSDLLDFLGEDEGNVYLRCLNDYRTANPVSVEERGKIRFEEFWGIMNLICSKQQFYLKDFLEKRLAVAAVIKKAFDLAYEVFTKTEEKIISLSDFLFFMGGYEKNYLEAANSVLLEGKKELYMKDFKNILYLIFSNQEFVLKDFLDKRIAITKVLSEAFTFACSHFNVGYRQRLRQSEFLDFVSQVDNINLHHVNVYWSSNLESINEQNNICFKRFADLVTFICAKQNFDIIRFLKKRIEVAKAIKKDYFSALSHYKIDQEKGFCKSKFLEFVGKKENLQFVNQCWSDNSMSKKQEDQIYLKEFSRLVYYICSKRGYDVMEFLNQRKNELNIVDIYLAV